MIILPAIDIQNGECVRLTKGDFATSEKVAEDPVETALRFKEAGARYLDVYKRQALGLDDAVREQLRLYIEAKNYPALNDLLDTFGSRHEAGVLKQLPRLFGGDGVFPEAEALLEGTDAEQPLSYLRSLYSKLDELELGDCVTVDLGIVNRTDYYTGIVFKGYIEGHGEEVLSGCLLYTSRCV